MADAPSISLDGAFAAVVAQVVRDVLRVEMADVRAKLAALAAATPPALVTVEVAAERLGKSTATIRRMAAAGGIPAKRVGRSWRIDLASIRPASIEQLHAMAAEARGGR